MKSEPWVWPGWQHEVTEAVLTHLLESSVRPRLTPAEQALLRSQGGPMSGVPFTSFSTSPISRFDSSVFRVLLLRRLWLPLPPCTRKCRCGRLLDVRGNHRAACAIVGALGRRGFPLESAAARVRWEAGARVSTNVLVWDLDLLPLDHQDGRKLEVVSHASDGVALRTARRVKTRTYPELTGEVGRAQLVVLATEVGGRWSEETQVFLRQLAKAKSKGSTSSPPDPGSSRVAAEVAHNLGMLQRRVVWDVSFGGQRRTQK